jgi:AraC-like DNA-binding protein
MLDTTSALAVPYVRLIGDQIGRMGVSLPHWLGLSGIRPEQLAQEDFVLDLAAFRSLALDARRLSEEPALGLLIGEAMGVQAHGALGYAAMSSRTVREVLTLIQRYIGLRIAMVAPRLEERPEEARVVLSELLPLGDVRSMALEGVVCTIGNLLRDVSMGACEVQGVSFPFPDPGYAPLAETLLRSPVRYDQGWAGLSLSPRTLDLQLKMSDPRAFRLAEDVCSRELLRLEERRSWEARVQRVLLETRVGFPSLDETARRLRVTSRTLHRRLVAEGRSFRAILEDLRHRGAVEQLTAGDSSIEEVAYILGYSDPANFRRAFRRWTGGPPSQFRRQLRP